MNYNHNILRCLISLILLTIGFNGCNMYSFSGASISQDTKTIFIENILNGANLISPNLSNNLTEKLKTKCLNETHLIWNEDNPDIFFSGFIKNYQLEPVAIQNNEIAAKNRLTITISITYTNKLDDTQNFSKVFSHYADFDSNENFSDKEEELNNDIIEDLIEDIFNSSFINW